MADTQTESSKLRKPGGVARKLEIFLQGMLILLGLLWVADVHTYLGFSFYREQYMGLFWALILGTVFLLVPAIASAPRDRVPWYDWIGFGLSLIVGLNVAINYQRLIYEIAIVTPEKWVLGALSLLLLIEATRRLVGKALLTILIVFILYGAFAEYMPGLLEGSRASYGRLVIYLYLDSNAHLGIPIRVASGIVLIYILLGNALFATGGGKFFTDLAMAMMGRFRGGPAKIAVVASTLFGTISGSAVSNVVTTGIITIPMMKTNRYRKEMAGAVEAVASTGGQIMPPVMGAAGFLIAEFLEISYGEVVLAAIMPALLYYFLLFIQVDLEAAKYGLAGLPASQLPKLKTVLRKGWLFILPLLVLIYSLFWLHYPPGKAGLYAVISVFLIPLVNKYAPLVVLVDALFSHYFAPDKAGLAALILFFLISLVKKSTGMNWKTTRVIITGTGRGLLEIGVITGIAGIIIGTLNLSGLGFNISYALVTLGGENIILLLLLAALVSIFLGMGMPTVSVYILLAVLIAPALEELGVVPMSAHLFIFYFGLLSMITPPVAIASYAAAAVAQSEPIRTGWESVKLGAMAYIVPFIFVFAPGLLLRGSVLDVLWAIVSTALGAIWLGFGLSGFLFRLLGFSPRLLFIMCALALFFDHSYLDGFGYWLNIGGATVGSALWAVERFQSQRTAAE